MIYQVQVFIVDLPQVRYIHMVCSYVSIPDLDDYELKLPGWEPYFLQDIHTCSMVFLS